MTATLELEDLATGYAGWHSVCALEDLELAWGEAALVAGRQVALPSNSPDRAFLEAQKTNLLNQLSTLTIRLNTVNTTIIMAG